MAGVHDLIKWLHSEGMMRKKIRIVCDNQSCVTTLNTTYFSLTDLDQAEADLIRSIRKLIINFDDLTIAWVYAAIRTTRNHILHCHLKHS